MGTRAAGVALFLPVPLVLALFTRQPLGARASLALGVALMLTHRLYARPWALARADRRCLWCAGAVTSGPALELSEPFGSTTWRACSEDHLRRLRRVLGWASRHPLLLKLGILGALAAFLVGAALASGARGPAMDDWVAGFRLAIALTVLSLALLGPRAEPVEDDPLALPFPVHIQALISTAWVLWLFRVIGCVWLVQGAGQALRRLGAL